MLRDLTIGQFYPADSILHKLDARVKIIGTLLYIVELFVFSNLYGYVFSVIFLAVMLALSKIPLRYIFKGIKPVALILLFTVVLNLFLIQGEYVFQWWIFKISKEGIKTAVTMAVRLILLIFGTSLLTFTTTPNNLTDALEALFKPLRLFKVPVHEIAMMMSIALRFIPILLEETDKIMKAQLARGADFESGNLIKRIKSMIPVLVPLFISSFRRANDLAMAMEARCYRGGDGRTKMKPLRFSNKDYIAFSILGIYLILLIAVFMVCYYIF